MQITETTTEGLTRRYQITVGAADIDRRLASRYAEIAKTVRLPGFRPGKVPVKIVRQRFGQAVLKEVLEETVNESSADTVKERNLRPALQPKIEIGSFGEGQDLVYNMQVEVLPEFALPDLDTIALERLKPEISDEEVDEAIGRLAERHRKAEPVAEGTAAETGDVVTVDFTGTIDGEPFAGGTATNHDIELGAATLIPGFEDKLLGAKVGDHVKVEVTFPADYPAEHLASKPAVFETDVKAVKRKAPAVIDDGLAEAMGFDDLAELKTSVRERLEREYAGLGRQRMKRELLDKLAAAHSFAVPEGMVEIEFSAIWRQFVAEREQAKAQGNYQPEEGEDDEKTKAEYRAIAERRVRLGLLLAEVGKSANIQVTQDEVNRAVAAEARQYPGQEKQVYEFYRNHPDAVQSLRAPIYEDKVVDHIFGTAKVTERSLPTKDFVAAATAEDEAPPEEAPAVETPSAETPSAETPSAETATVKKASAKKASASKSTAKKASAKNPAKGEAAEDAPPGEAPPGETPPGETPADSAPEQPE
ncbi:MAG TPA: trigger factor [Stellaceae bacterium]|nr:trigger factor [Stellaceae bacterium]